MTILSQADLFNQNRAYTADRWIRRTTTATGGAVGSHSGGVPLAQRASGDREVPAWPRGVTAELGADVRYPPICADIGWMPIGTLLAHTWMFGATALTVREAVVAHSVIPR